MRALSLFEARDAHVCDAGFLVDVDHVLGQVAFVEDFLLGGLPEFEVDRIRSEMMKMKNEYFELREASEKEVLNERNLAQDMVNVNEKPSIADMGISGLKK